jgi:hypothetical protein
MSIYEKIYLIQRPMLLSIWLSLPYFLHSRSYDSGYLGLDSSIGASLHDTNPLKRRALGVWRPYLFPPGTRGKTRTACSTITYSVR